MLRRSALKKGKKIDDEKETMAQVVMEENLF